MDAFIASVMWHHMLFAKTARGDIYRMWFYAEPSPMMQKLIGDEREYAEPLAQLAAQQDADDRAGMAWWNGLSDDDRKKWVQPSGRAKDAWQVYKSDNQDGGREARLVDRKARAFLVLAPTIGEHHANLVLALLLNAGLQILGPEQGERK